MFLTNLFYDKTPSRADAAGGAVAAAAACAAVCFSHDMTDVLRWGAMISYLLSTWTASLDPLEGALVCPHRCPFSPDYHLRPNPNV